MNKRAIFLLIPILIICGFLISSWMQFLSSNYVPNEKHYIALIGGAILLLLFFIHRTACLIATGVFLWVGIGGVLSLTVGIESISLSIGPINTPKLNGLCIGIFIIYLILNGSAINKLFQNPKKATDHSGK